MKEFAAVLIIIFAIAGAVGTGITAFTNAEWATMRSPKTGLCYETRSLITVLGIQSAMSLVDDKYCEKE